MEHYKAQPYEERESQKLTFGTYVKKELLWNMLPLITGVSAMAFGRLTNWKVPILNGSTDLVTSLIAKGYERFGGTVGKVTAENLREARWLTDWLPVSEEGKETVKKYFFNWAKGSEVAAPILAYRLWHKDEAKRIDLQEVDTKLHALNDLKPTDAELAAQNVVMRKELAFFGGEAPAPKASKASLEHHGTLTTHERERV